MAKIKPWLATNVFLLPLWCHYYTP